MHPDRERWINKTAVGPVALRVPTEDADKKSGDEEYDQADDESD